MSGPYYNTLNLYIKKTKTAQVPMGSLALRIRLSILRRGLCGVFIYTIFASQFCF